MQPIRACFRPCSDWRPRGQRRSGGRCIWLWSGRGYFVSPNVDELYRLLEGFASDVRGYALMGAGPPLMNTVTDDADRFREGFSRFRAEDRMDVLAGVTLMLGAAARYVGPDFLEVFNGLTAEQQAALHSLEKDYAHVPAAKDLRTMPFAELRAISMRHLNEVSTAFGVPFASR